MAPIKHAHFITKSTKIITKSNSTTSETTYNEAMTSFLELLAEHLPRVHETWENSVKKLQNSPEQLRAFTNQIFDLLREEINESLVSENIAIQNTSRLATIFATQPEKTSLDTEFKTVAQTVEGLQASIEAMDSRQSKYKSQLEALSQIEITLEHAPTVGLEQPQL